jgi:hypothetical protein
LPLLRFHLPYVANLGPVNILLAITNQHDGALNANLQALLAKFEPKIFRHIEAFGKSNKSVGLLFLREEVGEELRQTCLSISKAVACFIPMDFKKG